MPPNNPPTTYGTQLAGEILKTPLADWVQERRDAGKSWSAIAADLAAATNGQVTYTRQHLFRLYAPAPADRTHGGCFGWLPPVEAAQAVGISVEELQRYQSDGLVASHTGPSGPRVRVADLRKAIKRARDGDAA